jgi:outer membrane protein, multidrug efflux system
VNPRALVAAALVLAGCTVGPDYRRPDVPVPPDFRGRASDAPGGAASLGDVAWWQIFQDETLQSLIRIALVENYDVRIAAARVLDARSQVTIRRSLQYPDVSASASAPYTRVPGDRAPAQFEETFSPLGTLDLFWEVDLWGRLRRATEAARADLLASEAVQRFVVSTLVSDVATA